MDSGYQLAEGECTFVVQYVAISSVRRVLATMATLANRGDLTLAREPNMTPPTSGPLAASSNAQHQRSSAHSAHSHMCKKHHFINILSVCRVLLLRFFCDLCGRSLWLIERIVARFAGSPFCFWQPPNPIPEKQWCSMTTRMPSNQQLKGISRKQNVRKY